VPVFTVLIALVIGAETGSLRKVVGILLAVVGAMCMVVGSISGVGDNTGNADAATVTAGNQMMGDACILVNAIAMAVYYLLAKSLVQKYSAIHVAAWAYAFAATMMGLAALVWTVPGDWMFPKSMVAPLIYWIFICSVGGSLVGIIRTGTTHSTTRLLTRPLHAHTRTHTQVVTYAMNHLPASQVASFQCLQPFVGAILAVTVLGEHVNKYDLGGLGIVVGLLMVTSSSSGRTNEPQRVAHK